MFTGTLPLVSHLQDAAIKPIIDEIIRDFDIILIPSDKHQNIIVKIDLVFMKSVQMEI